MAQDKSISAFPDGENLFTWIGTISGPKDSVYETLKFKLSFQFPNSYPYTAPVVKFITPCFHPNVDTNGNICLDILKDKWSALYDVRTVLLSIQALLGQLNFYFLCFIANRVFFRWTKRRQSFECSCSWNLDQKRWVCKACNVYIQGSLMTV